MTQPLPSRRTRKPIDGPLFDRDRLLHQMDAYGLDALVLTSERSVFYLTGFNPIAHKADEPRPYALILKRDALDDAVLAVADYYISHFARQSIWVKDIRPVRAVMVPMDLPFSPARLDRFLSEGARQTDWISAARGHYNESMLETIRGALGDRLLKSARIGFDDLNLGTRLGLPSQQVVSAYDVLMATRQFKSAAEIDLILEATAINEAAISYAVDSWSEGMRWRDMDANYALAVVAQGGFIHDPGGMVLAHPQGADASVSLETGFEDFELEAGTHVMFDCHGTWQQYCWDGGKTWVVGSEPSCETRRLVDINAKVMETIEQGMRAGTRVSELQALGRDVYRKSGVTNADDVLIFFHGLGLSHMDLPEHLPDGSRNADWQVERDMVIATHLLIPGGERERVWLEDVAVVKDDGGESLFSWDYGLM